MTLVSPDDTHVEEFPPEVWQKLVDEVQRDTLPGFKIFYEAMQGEWIPDHAAHWVEKIYEARRQGYKGVMIKAFRGSTKTTTLTQLFVAYQTGLHPERTSLVLQVKDESAKDNTSLVSRMIERNPIWQALFPHVTPDKSVSWSEDGYSVRDTRYTPGDWQRLAHEKDPTLVGLGITSDAIIGKHPSNLLVIDDIENEENTSSDRQLQAVKRKVSADVMPCRTPNDPFVIVSYTPWVENDCYSAMEASGEFMLVSTPVQDADGVPAWKERLDAAAIEALRKADLTGGIEFARMYLLDLTQAKNRAIVYHLYPAHQINYLWPMGGGIDYAAVLASSRRTAQQSHFALAYVAKIPGGGAVVVDGVLEQCTQGEAEEHVVKAQETWPNWLHAVVEGDGKGEDFIGVLMRHPSLRIIPMKTGGKSKEHRLLREGSPNLRNLRVMISDAETKFLSALRSFLNRYPNVSEHDAGWDAWDSVYWGLRGMPDVIAMPDASEGLATGPRIRKPNPFASLGQSYA